MFAGLAVQAAEAAGADFIVKGLRTAGDFEIEQQMAHNNHQVTASAPCTCRAGPISVTSAAGSYARSPHTASRRASRHRTGGGALADRFGAASRSEEDT
jgi:hypothetical protein